MPMTLTVTKFGCQKVNKMRFGQGWVDDVKPKVCGMFF